MSSEIPNTDLKPRQGSCWSLLDQSLVWESLVPQAPECCGTSRGENVAVMVLLGVDVSISETSS